MANTLAFTIRFSPGKRTETLGPIRRSCGLIGPTPNLVFSDLVIQRAAINAENLCGDGDIPVGVAEGAFNDDFFTSRSGVPIRIVMGGVFGRSLLL